MAIEKLTDWISMLDEFLQSWAQVDAALAPNTLKLIGPYVRANLVADRTAVAAAFADVQAKLNAVQSGRGDRRNKTRALQTRFVQFRATMTGQLPGSAYSLSLPLTPQYDDPPGVWIDRTEAAANLWAKVNANNPPVAGFVPPLLLAGGYALADFTAESALVRDAFAALSNAEQTLQVTRSQRDLTLAAVRARLIQYRKAAVGALGAGHPAVLSLPKLSPKRKSRRAVA